MLPGTVSSLPMNHSEGKEMKTMKTKYLPSTGSLTPQKKRTKKTWMMRMKRFLFLP
jgi:hypothetical protein